MQRREVPTRGVALEHDVAATPAVPPIRAAARHVGLAPKRLNLMQAGAAAVTGLTALQGIDVHLRLRPGETVLVLGASGAVGSLAVQFARRHDARVIAAVTDQLER